MATTCARVLKPEPGDLILGQVVIKCVAVVKLGVNNRSGDSGSCFGIEIWIWIQRRSRLWQYQDLETDEIWSEKVRCSLKADVSSEWW